MISSKTDGGFPGPGRVLLSRAGRRELKGGWIQSPSEIYRNKTLAVATAAARPLSAVDVLVFIYAIAQAWQLSPERLTSLAEKPDSGEDTAARRKAVVTAVERMLQAQT